MEVSAKLTLEQMSKDLNRVAKDCDNRAVESNAFHTEMRDSTESIHTMLKDMSGKLVGIENKMDPDHDDYILRETNEKMDQLWGLFQGLSFAGNAIKYTAGVVAGISVIIVSLFALIRYVK